MCNAVAILLALLLGALVMTSLWLGRELSRLAHKSHEETIKLAVAIARYEEQATKAMMIFQRGDPWRR